MRLELLHKNDIQPAYEIICEWVTELKQRGINQYEHPYPPLELFRERQEREENFGLYSDKMLLGIVSLMENHIPEGWNTNIGSQSFLWLTTLFIPLKFKGSSYGKVLMKEVHKYASGRKFPEIYLDCYYGDGFLENYYKEFGYERVIKKIVHYSSRSFEALLMKKVLK